MPKFVPVIQKTVQLFTNELVIKKSVVAKKKNPFKMKGLGYRFDRGSSTAENLSKPHRHIRAHRNTLQYNA